jgi:hypothetical protein
VSSSPVQQRQIPGSGLLEPLAILAVIVLVLNDHWLKRLYPGWITGKLSDIAGLVFFPLLLQAFWELTASAFRRPWKPSPRVLMVCLIITAIAFTLSKTWIPAAQAYRVGLAMLQWPFRALGAVVRGTVIAKPTRVIFARDPTDLIALPALWLAWRIGTARIQRDSTASATSA